MFERNTIHDHLVCCFCLRDVPLETIVCMACHEYKGIMTAEDFEENYFMPFDCECE